MDKCELPSQWAKRMMDEAKTGEIAMMYFELMNLWKEREVRWGLQKEEEISNFHGEGEETND